MSDDLRIYDGELIERLSTLATVELLKHDFRCICGNNSHGQGAYYSDLHGNELEGPASEDDPGYWCCDNCGVIFDSHTGQIVYKRKSKRTEEE